jgi:hypothetical protein
MKRCESCSHWAGTICGKLFTVPSDGFAEKCKLFDGVVEQEQTRHCPHSYDEEWCLFTDHPEWKYTWRKRDCEDCEMREMRA